MDGQMDRANITGYGSHKEKTLFGFDFTFIHSFVGDQSSVRPFSLFLHFDANTHTHIHTFRENSLSKRKVKKNTTSSVFKLVMMYKLTSGWFLFCCLLPWSSMVNGQFSLSNALTGGGSSESGSSYPRIKLAGPLGQLIGGQGISLNSGLGQVLSSIISGAASGSSSNSNSGGPLSQLATAASTQYINAIRALPFGQFGLGGNGQSSGGPPQSPSHQPGHHGGPPGGPYNGPMYPGLSNSMNFMNDASMGPYGGQNFDAGAHFGPNSFPQFSPDSKLKFFKKSFIIFNCVCSSLQK